MYKKLYFDEVHFVTAFRKDVYVFCNASSSQKHVQNFKMNIIARFRGAGRSIIWGEGAYSYIRVLLN